ncbi:hypothetical protein DTO169E5_4787 [Paecilomyces variotii]|nr:hypothetical protein DTO169E5_4787 [Paecilomyces variotii]
MEDPFPCAEPFAHLYRAPMLLETEANFDRRDVRQTPTLCADSHVQNVQNVQNVQQDQDMQHRIGLNAITESLGLSQQFSASKQDPVEWHSRYRSCARHFLDHGQHSMFVQSLAAFLNIYLPCQRPTDPICGSSDQHPSNYGSDYGSTAPGRSPFFSLIPYIRRLIVTGTDSPSVLYEFFGGDWLAGVGPIHRQERINYLFTAKSSGWAATKREYDILPDQQVPFLRPIRDPLEEEISAAEARWSEWLAMEDWMVGPRSPF